MDGERRECFWKRIRHDPMLPVVVVMLLLNIVIAIVVVTKG